MTTLLRHSGGALARISKASLQSSLRRSQLTPTLTSRFTRAYATDPKKPKEKKDKKQDDAAEVIGKKAAEPSSKSAPGTENLHNNAKSAISPQPSASDQASETPKLKDGYVKLSTEDEAALDDVLRTLQMGMPKAQAEIVERAFAEIKKGGISPEVREMVDFMKSGKKMNLVTAAKFTRMVTTMSRKMHEREGGANKEPEFDFKDNDQKTGPKIPFEPFGKGKKQGKQDQSGVNFDIKLDTNTILLSAFVSYMAYRAFVPTESSRDITWQEFKTTFLDKGLVEKLTVVNGDRVRVDLHREATASMYPDSPASNPTFHYYFTIGSVEAFERKFDEAQAALGVPSSEQIPLAYASESSPLLAILVSFGPTVLFLGGLYFLSRRSGAGGGASGVFGMGKSRAKQFNHENEVKVKFKDVAGMDEAKMEIMEFVSFLKSPDQYKRLGAKIPRGAILSGPPGTGKTLLAKATAGESEVPFFSVSGSEFVEMFVGVGASRVRDLFATARKNAPCIIFIDEIDAIGKSRSKNGNFGGGNDEREATLNQILTEMDGFNTLEQVVVLAGTNRPDVLDKALMRPGRFDRHISIDSPTMEGRKQIFHVHLGKIVTSEDMDYLSGRLAALTPGFSGADIANCVNEAALIAARTSAVTVAMVHFEQAIERVIGGLEKKSLVLSPEEKKTVAYHEAGHAICGWYFKYADPLLKVSIIPRGQGALGYAQYLPKGDTYLMNVNQLMDRMAMTLGGRVSEELHFDTVTSGASDDFNKVTRLASAMVTQWGMSKKIGPLHYQDDDNKLHKPFAESTAQTIDSEVRRIVEEAYQQCKDLLTEKKTEIGIIAEELLAKEVLTREDMVRLLGKRPFDDNEEFNKYFGGPGQGFGGGKSAPPAPQPFPSTELDTPEPNTPVI